MKTISIILLLLLTGCTTLSGSKPIDQEKEDYFVILSSMLGINANRYTYTDKDGKEHSDQLRAFKELEEIYIRNIEPQIDGTFSPEQIKVAMFFSFYAKNRGSGAFSEYLASDLLPIYLDNKDSFLTSMSELPFIIPSVCDRMNAFFGFEGKNASKKESFIRDNLSKFKSQLTKEQVETCLAQFGK
jgi:hypothetical protein